MRRIAAVLALSALAVLPTATVASTSSAAGFAHIQGCCTNYR